MLLAVDVRNRTVSVGLYDSSHVLTRFRLTTAARTVDEWHFLFASWLRERLGDGASVTEVILSSVVPQLTTSVVRALTRFLPEGRDILVVGPGVKTGLRIRTDTPSEVGSDLVCNAVAALSLVKPPCLVVDFNSALSITALDINGDLLGVSLAPGLDAALLALREGGALLPEVRLLAPQKAIGKNTAESIRSGLLIGWTGLVNGIVDAMKRELVPPQSAVTVSLVGTGELDEPPVGVEGGFWVYSPWLTLDGLALIAEKNRQQGALEGV